MLRTLLLFFCFAFGWFCPGLAVLKPLMPCCLVYMLTVVFLRMEFTPRAISTRHWVVIGLNIAFALLIWAGMLLCGVPERFAQVAFFTAITPTATSAPVIVNFLGGSITFASMGFLLGALVVSASFPLLIPLVLHSSAWSVMPMIGFRICFVTLLPLVVALLLRKKFGLKVREVGKRLTTSTLYTWMLLVSIIAAAASETLESHASEYPRSDVLWVVLIDFLLCVFFFAVGAWIGYPKRVRECSQLLGQKNTSYTTYLAFTCGAPFAALGPAFYVFFHNAWNGIQLMFHRDRAKSRH